MATAKELDLSSGARFQHKNEAGCWILGVVHDIDGEGNVDAWVQVCNSSSPIDELFPEGKVEFKADDNGFSRIPEQEVRK